MLGMHIKVEIWQQTALDASIFDTKFRSALQEPKKCTAQKPI